MAKHIIELVPGVYRIPTLGNYINSYVFSDDDGLTLVDAGLKWRAPGRIRSALSAIGQDVSCVSRLILTHAHVDHAGGAAGLVRDAGLDGVIIHVDDVPFVTSGQAPPADPGVRGARLAARMPWGGFDPVQVGRAVVGEELLPVGGGLRVIHTPGHTPGHVSLLHEPSGVLITGDSIFNMNSRLTWPFAMYCTSFRQTKQTAHVLGELDYKIAAFTHGPEIRTGAREAVRGFLSRAA
ncbi:MAG: MBL fold metallo-hydrolase [Candidatus Nanopelagicales bacterium]|nr:MBL fold metallo-hydrolase [Candidatus Nanopelagicales bacterium]MDZ4249409.1 MBL fold metallo-hydrolase [Candidatus Nanopelagicales bacterium]